MMNDLALAESHESRSSEVSVLISRRLRRMVSESLGNTSEVCTHGVPWVPVFSRLVLHR